MASSERLEAGLDLVVDYESIPPLVPDGVYEAVYVRHSIATVFNTRKLFVWFRIVEHGDYYQHELFRAYRLKGKKAPDKKGALNVGVRSDLYRMLVRVQDIKLRTDRLSLRSLKGVVLQIKTRTVSKDFEQRELPTWLRYSVVDDVLKKLTGH